MKNINHIITNYIDGMVSITLIQSTTDKVIFGLFDRVSENIEEVINKEIYQLMYWRILEKVV